MYYFHFIYNGFDVVLRYSPLPESSLPVHFYYNQHGYHLYLQWTIILYDLAATSFSISVVLLLLPSTNIILNIRLCKWLKQLDSKLSPVKGFMGSNPLSMVLL